MKRVIVYLDAQAFEELKKLAESRKQSLSQLARDMIVESLRTGELKERIRKLELKENGDFTELNEEMNMIWEVTGKLDKALRKLNRGETLEESDFVYSEESVKQ